jgi:hypothetical protein
MKTQTKIGIGVGLAIIAYLLLSKKASAAKSPTTPSGNKIKSDSVTPTGGGTTPMGSGTTSTGSEKTTTGGGTTTTGGGVSSDKPTPAKTKDCVQVGYDCTKKTYNTIQIPIDADCNAYQPAMPQCAPPMGGGGGKVFIPEPLPIDCELFPDNAACYKKKSPVEPNPIDTIETPIESPIYGGGGEYQTPIYGGGGGGRIDLPYYGGGGRYGGGRKFYPTDPIGNLPIYGGYDKLYPTDPLPIDYGNGGGKNLYPYEPIDYYTPKNTYQPSTPSYGGSGGSMGGGYGGNSGGGGFFGGGGGGNWLTDWGFGIPLSSGGGRKGSVIVPPTDFDEYGNLLT